MVESLALITKFTFYCLLLFRYVYFILWHTFFASFSLYALAFSKTQGLWYFKTYLKLLLRNVMFCDIAVKVVNYKLIAGCPQEYCLLLELLFE